MNFFEYLKNLLKQDERFFSIDGQFLRNATVEAANKYDENLLKILLDDDKTAEKFFVEVKGVKVFKAQEFIWMVNNREFLPGSYTRFKNKIGLVDSNGEFFSTDDSVELVFPYKDCYLEGGQTKDDQKRSEIFYNELLASDDVDRLLEPKVLTCAKKFSSSGVETVTNFSDTDNLIIKGNNLLALACLLKRFQNKIKCIYIDPPYNPQSNANTFAYNNSFNRSTWLVFMKNRLEMAKKLLAKNGVLIVAIDKNEQPRLQILIEEIFPEYDVDCITVIHNPRGTIGSKFSYTHEFAIFVTPKNANVICERTLSENEIDWSPLRNWGGESLRTDAKNCFYPIIVKDEKIVGFGEVSADNFHPNSQTIKVDDEYYIYPIDSKGIERKWRYARQSVESICNLLRVKKIKSGYDIEIGKNFGAYKTVWTDSKFDASVNGTQLLKNILPDTVFSYPKSLYTVMECLNAVVKNDKNALILDFFGGSGTTGHAVMEINKNDGGNRRFILVEQMDYIETETLQRNITVMKKIAPNSSIVYCKLAKLNQKFIEEIQAAKTFETIWEIYQKMVASGYISYKIFPADIDAAVDDFKNLTLENQQRFLMELLDKNLLYVNYCDIDDEDFNISDADKKFSRSFYNV